MKALKVFLIISAVICLIVIALLGIVTKVYLTPERVNEVLCRQIGQQLRRRVSIKGLDVGLWQGIRLSGVVVHKSLPWEQEDVFTCEKVSITLARLPLLMKQMVVRKVRFERPVMHVQLGPDRSFSLYGRERPPRGDAESLNVLLLPSRIRILGGMMVGRDDGREQWRVTHVIAAADHISLLSPFDFVISARMEQNAASRMRLQGTYNVRNNIMEADIAVTAIPLSVFNPYLGLQPVSVQDGTVNLKAKLKAEGAATVVVDGDAAIEDLHLVWTSEGRIGPPAGLKAVQATFDFQARYSIPEKLLTLEKIHGNIFASPFTGRGSIKSSGRQGAVNVSLRSDSFSLGTLCDRLYYGEDSFIQGLKLTGTVGLQMDFRSRRGLGLALTPTCIISLQGNRIMYPPLGGFVPELEGQVRIDSHSLTIPELQISTPGMSIIISGDIEGYTAWPPRSNVKVLSSRIDFNTLFENSQSDADKQIGPFDLKGFALEGPIQLGTLSFLGMRLDNVRGRYALADNIFSIQDLEGMVDGGGFALSGSVDLGVRGLGYQLLLTIADIPLKTVLEAVPGYYATLADGALSGTCALRGNGTGPGRFWENLRGDAVLSLAEGTIMAMRLMPQLAQFISLPSSRNIQLTKALLQMKLRERIVEVEGAFQSPELEIFPSGLIGLDAALDLDANLKVAPDLFAGISGQLARYLPQEDGWITLPLTIQGTLPSPEVALDDELVDYIINKTLPKLLKDILAEKRQEARGDIAVEPDEPELEPQNWPGTTPADTAEETLETLDTDEQAAGDMEGDVRLEGAGEGIDEQVWDNETVTAPFDREMQ